jgi:hypothetical protein
MGRGFYFLRPFIWSSVSGLVRFREASGKGTSTTQPSCPGWRELDLSLWPRDKATIIPTEKSKLTDIQRSKVKSTLIIVFDIKGTVHKIRPGRPNRQFRILLWRFAVTAWKCEKTSPGNLATNKLAVASHHQNAPTHTSFLTSDMLTMIWKFLILPGLELQPFRSRYIDRARHGAGFS